MCVTCTSLCSWTLQKYNKKCTFVYIQKNTHASNRNRPLYDTVNSFMKSCICHEPISGFNPMDGERLTTCFCSELHITHFDHEDVSVYSSKMLATHPTSTEGRKETWSTLSCMLWSSFRAWVNGLLYYKTNGKMFVLYNCVPL